MSMYRKSLLALLALSAGLANAHHGSSGQFDESKTIKVDGVVTKMRLVNPHSYVYFNVKNAAGGVDEWRCEMRAGALLRRSGWTEEMFAPGTHITVIGAPARREPHGCYVETVEFDTGKAVERYAQLENADKGYVKRDARLPDGKPNLQGNWAAPQRLLTAGAGGAPGAAARGAGGPPAAGAAPGAVAPGARGAGGPPRYQQSAAGIKAGAGYKREDNPRFHCQATNIFADWTFDQHVNRIDQTAKAITMKYGHMDIVRTIHLDQATHPKNLKLSRAGHSIGKWDGDTLVVDTVGFLPGYLQTGGPTSDAPVKHSDKLHVVERFTLSKDAESLARTWVGDDALYLTKPFEGRDEVQISQSGYEPYDCKDLTTEVVPGY